MDLENDVIWVFCENAWEDRRKRERMMSRCFTEFPISGLGKPKLYQNMWCFTRIGEFTWRLSDSVKN